MKTSLLLLCVLISASLLASAPVHAAGNGRSSGRSGNASTIVRGNPKSTGTPLQDGSGKTTAPGRGAKDGTGNQANCPNR